MVRIFGNNASGAVYACFGILLFSITFLMVSRFGIIEAAAGIAITYIPRFICKLFIGKVPVSGCRNI
jgi:hypothetical protein